MSQYGTTSQSASMANRNGNAAMDWANQRKLKIEHARKVREERLYSDMQSSEGSGRVSSAQYDVPALDAGRLSSRSGRNDPPSFAATYSGRMGSGRSSVNAAGQMIMQKNMTNDFGATNPYQYPPRNYENVQNDYSNGYEYSNSGRSSRHSTPPRSAASSSRSNQGDDSHTLEERFKSDALAYEVEKFGGTKRDDGRGSDMSYEFAASVPRSTSADISSFPSSRNSISSNGANTPPTSRSVTPNLSLLKSKLTKSASSSSLRQRPGSRNAVSQSKSDASLESTPPKKAASNITCTRQSGCGCPQCNADAGFQSFLRSDPSASRSKAADTRPPWNMDVDEPAASFGNYAAPAADPYSKTMPARSAPSNRQASNTRKPTQVARPPWNDDAEVEAPVNNVNRMRDELSGGKADFFDQVENRNKPASRPPSMQRNPQFAQQKPDNRQQQQPAATGYRGMYMPDDQGAPSSNTMRAPANMQQRSSGGSSARNTTPRQMPPSQSNAGYGMGIEEIPINQTQSADMPSEFAPPTPMVECGSCGRKFNETSIEKHQKICQKVFQSKRKVFDTTKARISGAVQSADDMRVLEQAAKPSRGGKGGAAAASKKKNSSAKWKQQSQALREAMKYSKMMSEATANGQDISSLPPPPAAVNNDLVPCPHCGRSFNDIAAERHIPKCKDTKAKPTRLKRGTGKMSASVAKR